VNYIIEFIQTIKIIFEKTQVSFDSQKAK